MQNCVLVHRAQLCTIVHASLMDNGAQLSIIIYAQLCMNHCTRVHKNGLMIGAQLCINDQCATVHEIVMHMCMRVP